MRKFRKADTGTPVPVLPVLKSIGSTRLPRGIIFQCEKEWRVEGHKSTNKQQPNLVFRQYILAACGFLYSLHQYPKHCLRSLFPITRHTSKQISRDFCVSYPPRPGKQSIHLSWHASRVKVNYNR